MRIDEVICGDEPELHIWSRHRVTVREVAEGLYLIYGRTEAGRYLTIVVRYLGNRKGRLITARDMNWAERRRYERHRAH